MQLQASNSDQNHWYVLDSIGNASSLDPKVVMTDGTWWERNQKWALPVLLATAAAVVYNYRDQQVQVDFPRF